MARVAYFQKRNAGVLIHTLAISVVGNYCEKADGREESLSAKETKFRWNFNQNGLLQSCRGLSEDGRAVFLGSRQQEMVSAP